MILSRLNIISSFELERNHIEERSKNINLDNENLGFHQEVDINDVSKIFEEYKKFKENHHLDLYDYWKKISYNKFKKLSIVVVEILSIIDSSASSEKQFSISKSIIGYKILRLKIDHVHDLSIIKNNKDIPKTFI